MNPIRPERDSQGHVRSNQKYNATSPCEARQATPKDQGVGRAKGPEDNPRSSWQRG